MPETILRYNVFISSPSDVENERNVAKEVIEEWNTTHAQHLGIEFRARTYETDTWPDLNKTPQDAINDQALSNADILVGILHSRMGTKTENFLSGTDEEISYFKQKNLPAMIFFCSRKIEIDMDQDKKLRDQAVEQAELVLKYKKRMTEIDKRYCWNYREVDDFRKKLSNALKNWAKTISTIDKTHAEVQSKGMCVRDYDLKKLPSTIEEWNSVGQKGMILLYNIELHSFKEHFKFEQVWGQLQAYQNINKVIMLLPPLKTSRLLNRIDPYIDKFISNPANELFEVSKLETDTPKSTPTNIGFVMFRYGDNPRIGEIHPKCFLYIHESPFSNPNRTEIDSPDTVWEYQQVLEFQEAHEYIHPSLEDIWGINFKHPAQTVFQLLKKQKEEDKKIKNPVPPHILLKKNKQFIPSYRKSRSIREHLFNPNVPSLVLDEDYFMLDWNLSFELVFPTHEFHRGQFVTHFIECLSNKEEVLKGANSFTKEKEPPLLHMEDLIYDSPLYGKMVFTKVASPVGTSRRGTHVIKGWNLDLNLNQVELREKYNGDLVTVIENDALVTRYAQSFDQVFSESNMYQQLLRLHCQALDKQNNILDLGCGSGHLALDLHGANKNIVAIDSNEAMLDCLINKSKAKKLPIDNLQIWKANIESINGLPSTYDGVAIFNGVDYVKDLDNIFKIIFNLMEPHGILAFSVASDKFDPPSFFRLLKDDFIGQGDREEWDIHYSVFKAAYKRRWDSKMLNKYKGEEVKDKLKAAGFKIRDEDINDQPMEGQRIFFKAQRP